MGMFARGARASGASLGGGPRKWECYYCLLGSKELRQEDRIAELAALARKPRAWVEKRFPYFNIITVKNVIASVALVRLLCHGVWKVGWIYTRPEFRNRGLATRVLRSAVTRAFAEGAARIVARVYKSNLASRRVFKKAGFRVWASTPPAAQARKVLKIIKRPCRPALLYILLC